nr:hypothetical protein [Tanacetum cinerariifolium]
VLAKSPKLHTSPVPVLEVFSVSDSEHFLSLTKSPKITDREIWLVSKLGLEIWLLGQIVGMSIYDGPHSSVIGKEKRIPNKYKDTVCELNKKKQDTSVEIDDQDEIRVTNDELGDNGGNGGNKCVSENGDEIRTDCDANEGITCVYITDKVADDVVLSMKQVNTNESEMCGNTDKVRIGEDKSYKAYEDAEADVYNVSDSKLNKHPDVKNMNFPTRPTYAFMASNNAELNRNLDFEPTLTEGGNEFVIFNEDLVNNGTIKWKFTICGHFVGMRMSYNEFKYNLVRSMDFVRCLAMIMRYLIVQKWSSNVSLDKPEPDKIPLWVKMHNVPLEAWNKKGISKLASSIGKPLVMDEMTANMCQYGRGRIGYARDLVEVDARKQFKESIDVQYRDNNGSILRTIKIKIEYSWKPNIPNVSLDKPDKIPLWVKMHDVPLEAWNNKGIGKLASSIGKPLVIDEMTANMCQYGIRRIGYARVLVKVDDRKQFKEGIDVQYRDNNGSILRTKKIRIEYSWKPYVCDFCHVFGHTHKTCMMRPRSTKEMGQLETIKVREDVNMKAFTYVRRKQYQQNNVYRMNQQAKFRRSNEVDLSKDMSGLESPPELRRSWYVKEISVYVNLTQHLAPSVGPGIPIYQKKKTKKRMVDSQPMEEGTQGTKARDVRTETHEGPTEPVSQMQKTTSSSSTFIKENIDVLRTMIKEHDQQAKTKAMPKRLAYADSDKEALARLLARGFSDRLSLESFGTTDTHRQAHSVSKSQRTPSKNKEPSHLRRSSRLEDWSRTKEKIRKERSKSRWKWSGHQGTSSNSVYEEAKLGTPLMLDSYTYVMCMESWCRLSFARAKIELRADVELKDTIVVSVPKLIGDGFSVCTIRVAYEWNPLCVQLARFLVTS